jgi:hypothetical protein
MRDTGFSLFQRIYGDDVSSPDQDLLSGFISAIYNFFKNYCEDQIMKMETKLLKFFYHNCGELIFVMVTELENDKDEKLITDLLQVLAKSFVYKFGAKTNEEIDRTQFSYFEKIADQFIEEYNETNSGDNLAKSSLEALDNFTKNTIHKILVYDSLKNK